ncbi:hypothetical protein ACN38_g3292, partial [Penicillium nordicum]
YCKLLIHQPAYITSYVAIIQI